MGGIRYIKSNRRKIINSNQSDLKGFFLPIFLSGHLPETETLYSLEISRLLSLSSSHFSIYQSFFLSSAFPPPSFCTRLYLRLCVMMINQALLAFYLQVDNHQYCCSFVLLFFTFNIRIVPWKFNSKPSSKVFIP